MEARETGFLVQLYIIIGGSTIFCRCCIGMGLCRLIFYIQSPFMQQTVMSFSPLSFLFAMLLQFILSLL